MPRIAVCGCNGVDKPNFVKSFIQSYPMYKIAGESYKKLFSKDNVYGSQELQWSILNAMVDDVLALNKSDNVIINHSILDNLVDTMWLNSHLYPEKLSNVDDSFVRKSVALVKQTLHFLDLIIWIPKRPWNHNQFDGQNIKYDNPNDEVYDAEIDNFLAAIEETYTTNKGVIFDINTPDGTAAMIQVFGTPEERISIMNLYVDTKTGDFIGKNPEDSLIQLPPDLESQVLFDTISKQISGK